VSTYVRSLSAYQRVAPLGTWVRDTPIPNRDPVDDCDVQEVGNGLQPTLCIFRGFHAFINASAGGPRSESYIFASHSHREILPADDGLLSHSSSLVCGVMGKKPSLRLPRLHT